PQPNTARGQPVPAAEGYGGTMELNGPNQDHRDGWRHRASARDEGPVDAHRPMRVRHTTGVGPEDVAQTRTPERVTVPPIRLGLRPCRQVRFDEVLCALTSRERQPER